MNKINWSNLFIVVALVLAVVGLVMPPAAAPAPVGVGTQSFQCAPSTMCVTDGGKTVTFPSGSTFTIDSGATFSSGATQTGADVNLSGGLTANTATITNATSSGSLAVGGGYSVGGSGCSISDAGALQCNGAALIDNAAIVTGALTANSAVITGAATTGGVLTANGGAAITGSLTISGFTQYPFVFFGSESAVNGTEIAHGRGQTLTYPWCMVYDAAWVTATARISATNSTSVTLAIFGTDGEPWTTPPVPVRCGAVYVP